MNESNRFPILIPLSALAFAVVHLTFEYLSGGVRIHNLLHRPDLPAISNWYGLITLPILGVILGLRVRTHPSLTYRAALVGSFIYGAAMAASFSLGQTNITTVAFLGLFVCGLLLPVYRVEYMLGFVAGMTFTFGGVLPLLVALVVAAVSFVARFIGNKVMGVFHKWKTSSGQG